MPWAPSGVDLPGLCRLAEGRGCVTSTIRAIA
ncbi:unnamed protein product (plasmid) [Mycetohabitans rhizoxinica HKI 454]|uniref:Uncharacterized protein n=1 Tax=Mycetohabitans rhizoxinica (strain DSM 19002 / CIP 109453 / HKI 454) TaxID=882378 RepID=E5AU97_MYCRK|nr:unnamed protein product [Mycetohabitans rhizoxinica HKI 454]